MKIFLSLILLLIPCASLATDQSPYAGEDLRAVKSLSEQEVESLRRGDGMGFAKLAELNHYPGPRHVLEISGELGLSPSQIADTRALYEEMRSSAMALGEKLLAAEARLDRQFEDESITARKLNTSLREIGKLRSRLRYVHLEAHLRQKKLLNPEQLSKYDSVRGYHGMKHDHDAHPGRHN